MQQVELTFNHTGKISMDKRMGIMMSAKKNLELMQLIQDCSGNYVGFEQIYTTEAGSRVIINHNGTRYELILLSLEEQKERVIPLTDNATP